MKIAVNKYMLTLIVGMFLSCGTIKPLPEARSPAALNQQYFPTVKHDTIIKQIPPTPRKRPTSAQVQAYLRPFYKDNFDFLFAPKFDEIIRSNANYSKALKEITSYMLVTRERTDSIIRERNFYRAEWLKGQRETLNKQNEIIILQRIANKRAVDSDVENKKQIKINTWLASLCLTGFTILAVIVFGLYFRTMSISKKIDELKRSPHVL